ncbi:helix-turn-helix domain-containing protein [Saccharomonospora halophila]|uniref:helix-turn-helix domain-containing protein n=1 Tax=Saccharomonospora halophila TaxID=129922 RepID=UPI0003A8BE99|nr:helix-turn-helix transcriptional regulator [Saccharomonospora halophila]
MTPTLGQTLRRLRHARGKSLAVVAGLAGISPSYLSRLESGDRALDRRSLIVALADALDVAPSELAQNTVAEIGPAGEERALIEVRLALLSVGMQAPNGVRQPVEALRTRVAEVLTAQRNCDHALVGDHLPGLIHDLHASLRAGRDEWELLRLAVLTHVQGTQAWLCDVGAQQDLAWQAATLARVAAERLDEPTFTAISAFGNAFALLGAGGLDLMEQVLTSSDPGTATSGARQMSGMLTLASSLLAATQGRDAQQQAALDRATDLAAFTGEGNAFWFGFGPANVGVWQLSVALECGEHARAVRIAEQIDPSALPATTRRAAYYRDYGRALARVPRHRDTAVRMLREAERLSPARIQRQPSLRTVLTELLTKTRSESARRELHGMAYRSGLPV